MKIGIETNDNSILLQSAGENLMILGFRKSNFSGVDSVKSCRS